MSKFLIITGIILLIAGLLWQFAPQTLAWFGKLPGDIRVETAHGKIFMPFTSMLLISVILSLALNFLNKLF